VRDSREPAERLDVGVGYGGAIERCRLLTVVACAGIGSLVQLEYDSRMSAKVFTLGINAAEYIEWTDMYRAVMTNPKEFCCVSKAVRHGRHYSAMMSPDEAISRIIPCAGKDRI